MREVFFTVVNKTTICIRVILSQGRQTISEENRQCQGEGCDDKVAGRGLPVVMGVFLDNRSSEPVLKAKHEFGRKIKRSRGIWAELPAWAKVHSLHVCTQAFRGYRVLTMSQVLGEPRDTECVLECGRNSEDGMEGAKLEAGGPVKENTGRVQTRVDEP